MLNLAVFGAIRAHFCVSRSVPPYLSYPTPSFLLRVCSCAPGNPQLYRVVSNSELADPHTEERWVTHGSGIFTVTRSAKKKKKAGAFFVVSESRYARILSVLSDASPPPRTPRERVAGAEGGDQIDEHSVARIDRCEE